MDGKLWVALEGPCCAGKTTLSASLAQAMGDLVMARVVCFADHVGGGRFLPQPVPESATEDETALRTLLAIDADRVVEAQRAPADLVLMDRSVHTLLAHRHAIQSITGLALSEPAARVVAASRLAAWPDTVIFLDVPHPTILDRNRGKFPPGSIFIDAAYNRAFRQYFTTLADEPGARVVRLDATAKPEDLVAAAKAHIRYLLPIAG